MIAAVGAAPTPVYHRFMEEDSREGALLGDRYRIEERIAVGGMGAVYRATQLALNRHVAIKFLHGWMALDIRARRRFEVEAQAMAVLRHPNCAQVLDFGLDGETPYLVMELVEGKSLGDILESGPLPAPRALTIARQALSALAHAHEHGITHRDIKPDNIMIGAATAVGDHVRILDFGIARLKEDEGALTGGMAIGTPKYMAPEQASGAGVDARADLYAMAVVLFEMLVGRPPFTAAEPVDILRMHRDSPPPRLADELPLAAISSELEAAIGRALVKSPEGRFQDALAFSEALAACPEASGPADRPLTAPPEPAPVPLAQAHPPSLEAHPPAPGSAPAPEPAPPPTAGAAAWLRRHPVVALGLAAAFASLVTVAVLAEGAPQGQGGRGGALARGQQEEVEGLAAARKRVENNPEAAVGQLEELTREHDRVAEAWFLLGRAYFARMWWTDGLEAFRRAIELDDRYRSEAILTETLTEGFISPRAHDRIADFLADEVGPPARPHLERVAERASNRRIRERAAAALERF